MNRDNLLNNANMRFEPQLLEDPELPFVFHEHMIYDSKALNIHENLEVLYFPEGEGYVLYDGARCPVRAGNLVVVNSYSAHQVMTDTGLHQFCLIVDRNFCRHNSIDPSLLQFQKIISDREVSARFDRVIEAYRTPGDFQKAVIKGAVFDLLLFLCLHYCQARDDEKRKSDPSVEYVRRTIGYMKTNLARKLTVDEIAASVGISRYHFQREFKRITGYTPKVYLNTVRFEHAKNLLESGQYSIKEISFMCGFSNSDHFSRAFQQQTGMLPSQLWQGKK